MQNNSLNIVNIFCSFLAQKQRFGDISRFLLKKRLISADKCFMIYSEMDTNKTIKNNQPSGRRITFDSSVAYSFRRLPDIYLR